MNSIKGCLLLWGGMLMLIAIYQHNQCMILSHQLKIVTTQLQKERSREQVLLSSIAKWGDYSLTYSIATSKRFVFLKWHQYFPQDKRVS